MTTLTNQIWPRLVTYAIGATPSTGPFAIPFPFFDDDEVHVYIDGVETNAFSIAHPDQYGVTGNEVTLDVAQSDVVVSVVSEVGGVRTTAETMVVGEVSREFDRIFAIIQELQERGLYTTSLGDAVDLTGRRITGVADPVDPEDLTNKAYVDVLQTAATGAITTAKNAALAEVAASSAAAATDADDAAASEAAAAASAAAALASETAAAASEAAAGVSETNAAASAAEAAGYAGGVKVSVNDTVAGVLTAKITAAAAVSLTEINDGGDEDLQVGLNFASQAEAEAGTATDKALNALRTRQAVTKAGVPVLLATLATSSGTSHTASSLDLTPYNSLLIVGTDVKNNAGGSTYLKINGSRMAGSANNTQYFNGPAILDLETSTLASFWGKGTPTAPQTNALDGASGIVDITRATTSITFDWADGVSSFTGAGSTIEIYGVI